MKQIEVACLGFVDETHRYEAALRPGAPRKASLGSGPAGSYRCIFGLFVLIAVSASTLAGSGDRQLSTHKVAGVRERIETIGAELLYLPPYSMISTLLKCADRR